ncbi:MAG: D-Ala-D-Ala carboxypeptidase family metallohydrolase [Aeromonas sp.]
MKLSKWFTRKEFKCKCNKCDHQTVDAELLMVLDDVREKFGPVVITSAHRCLQHNRSIGSSDGSQHVRGCAADFRVSDLHGAHRYLLNKYPDRYGIAVGSGFVHVDTRSSPARWTY